MRLTFRSRLIALVAVGAVALLVLVLASSLIERRIDRELDSIQRRYVPRIGLKPRLEAGFERLGRSFQDAAAAGDADLLASAEHQVRDLLAQVAAAEEAIAPDDAARLRLAIEDYAETALTVSRRMIADDTGEGGVAAMEEMQHKRARAAALIEEATRFDGAEMATAFQSAADAQRTGARIRLIASVACVLAILALSMWIGRGLFSSLGDLAAGLRRFGDGQFATPIPVHTHDELGDVAEQANQMAAQLQLVGEERDRSDWLKTGHAGLVEHLRGELEPHEVADRALTFLARHLGAPVGALYYTTATGELTMLGRYGVAAAADELTPSFRPGDGLVGQAALTTEITVIAAPPDGSLRVRTGLIEGHPCALVFIPLLHLGSVSGMLELVMLEPWSAPAAELATAVRESLTIAIEVARARTATRTLLAKTQRQTAELLDARAGLEQKASELARASAYKSQFLANMSHELRTPLNAIIGFSELMHDGLIAPDSPQHHEFLGHILTSGRHLLQLINDVLDLAKVEAGKLEFHPESLGLSTLIGELMGILGTTARNRGVRIETHVAPEVDELTLDPSRLKQVLYNYLSNAIKFTPEGGRVEVRATAEGDHEVRIEVEDTGVGIATEDLSRLFVDFQQLRGDGKQTGGTGLGLALTRRLVEAQGGTVGARSVRGKGSVFHAILPRRADLVAATMAVAPPPLTAGRPDAPIVLVVEDDAADQATLATALAAAGYLVEVVASGARAVARTRERAFDAITLDILLPDMSGLEVLRQIRTGGPNQHVPVVLITVVAETNTLTGFAVQDVLPKPVDGEVLLASLLRAGVAPSASGTVLVVDDDPASLRLMSLTLHQLGYQTRCERDGEQALQAARATPPTAIVLDLLMPGMSGFEFLDHLRQAPSGQQVPVIVWTSKDLTAAEQAVLRASASAVVSKGHGGSAGVIAELAAHLPGRRAGAA